MKSRKPKIAVIGLKGLPAFGGAASVGENIIIKLYNSFQFTVYSISSHTHLKSGEYQGVCYQVVFQSIKNKKLNTIIYYLRSAIHVLNNDYDLIHLHHRDASFIIPLLRLKYKVMLTTHGMVLTDKWKRFSFAFTLQDKIFLRYATTITTVSKKDYQIVTSILKRNTKSVKYIPNGVNLLSKSFVEKNYITFAAGRIIPNKGLHLLLEALIKCDITNEVKIIGDLSQMSAYEYQIDDLIAKLPNVSKKGLIKEKKALFETIGGSKLFVYPSLIESMSMMMLEVASLKVPIICSRIKENTDVFTENEVLYFENNNINDLAEKITWALDNMSRMHEKAKNAYIKLIKSYLWKDITIQYSNVYDSLLEK